LSLQRIAEAGPGVDAELREDTAKVRPDGAVRDEKSFGYVLVRESRCGKQRHLAFLRRQ
jgi:hypothetical protein